MLLVEHDPELISRADWVVDMGPGAVRSGGHVVVTGKPADVAAHPDSLTGRYLAGRGPRVDRARRPRRRVVQRTRPSRYWRVQKPGLEQVP